MNRLQQRVEKLGGILDVAKALVAERDLDRLLKLIVHAAARVVEADRCSLFLVDRERGELPIGEYTPLYERYAEAATLARLYVEPERWDEARRLLTID